jgi:hypothetical protein
MSATPSANGDNGERDALGRFRPGNKGGPGNPVARKTAAIRKALFAAVRPADVKAVVRALISQAKAGDVPAIKELFDRLIGKSVVMVAEPDRPDESPGEIVFTIVPSAENDRPESGVRA